MKIRSSLIVPVLATSILAPAAGSAVMNHSNKTNTSATHEYSKYEHHHKGNGEKKFMNIINKYASSDLKTKLTQDLATHKNLENKLHNTTAFKKQEGHDKSEQQAFFKAHKQEINSIKQQEKDGKITKQEAHKKFEAIFGNHEGKNHDNDKDKFKGKENGERGIFKELKSAVQKKDQAAINTALEKFDQKLQQSNQELQKKLNTNK
jgi:hypothetical protein